MSGSIRTIPEFRKCLAVDLYLAVKQRRYLKPLWDLQWLIASPVTGLPGIGQRAAAPTG